MEETVKKLLAQGKGILAADESLPSIEKRFKTINLESTEENRRAYREMLFTTPGIEAWISGVILFDETLRQSTAAGKLFPQYLTERGIVPGIKVDTGTKPLPSFEGEKITEGLDGLGDRFAKYYELGARFSKWRAVITIGKNIPSEYALRANAQALTRFAALSQATNIVPIVEPEVLMDGGHDIITCEKVTIKTHEILFEELLKARVKTECVILKTNMVVPGKESTTKATAEEVATATLRALKAGVPTSLPGIVFLSGGLDDESATTYLNAINKMDSAPWRMTFSFGRALQNEALTTWAGKVENVAAAQAAFAKHAQANSSASDGKL